MKLLVRYPVLFKVTNILIKYRLGLVITLILLCNNLIVVAKTLPDFSQFPIGEARKTAFYNFFRPIIKDENAKILKERDFMLSFKFKYDNGIEIPEEDIKIFHDLAKKYKLDSDNFEKEYFWDRVNRRVDHIPFEIAMAQAAVESGWGTSGFAIQANNIFGVWTYEQGTGIVPKERIQGATHEIRIYDNVESSIASYMLNLNTNKAYRRFRDIRWELRLEGVAMEPILMCEGLKYYSQRRMEYVNLLQKMIRSDRDIMVGED